MRRRLSLWGPVAIWAGLIFFLSSLPHLNSGLKEDFILRKMAHLLEYTVLAVLLSRALRGTWAWTGPALAAGTFFLCVLYAVSDEGHQSFVPGRRGAPTDVLIDAAGAGAAVFFLRRRR